MVPAGESAAVTCTCVGRTSPGVPGDPDGRDDQDVQGGQGVPDAVPGEATCWDGPGGTCDLDAVVGDVDAGDVTAACGTWVATLTSGAAAWAASAVANGVDAGDADDVAAALVEIAVGDAEDAGGAAAACSAARGSSWVVLAWCDHSGVNVAAKCVVPDASDGGKDVVGAVVEDDA